MGLANVIIKEDGTTEPTGRVVNVKPQYLGLNCLYQSLAKTINIIDCR